MDKTQKQFPVWKGNLPPQSKCTKGEIITEKSRKLENGSKVYQTRVLTRLILVFFKIIFVVRIDMCM